MFKKIAASVALALSLAACAPVDSAPAPVEVKTADTKKIRAAFEKESNKVYDFEKPYGKLKKINSNKPKAVKPKTEEFTSEDAALIVAEAQLQQEQLEQEQLAAPAAPEVPVQPEVIPPAPVVPEVVIPVTPAPVQPEAPKVVQPKAPTSNWATELLAANGYSHVTVEFGNTTAFCGAGGGCAYVGGTFMMINTLYSSPSPEALHVFYHELAHITGIKDECAAESFAHQHTGNTNLWSYYDLCN